MLKTVITCAAVLALAVALPAQEEKSGAAKKGGSSGILQPQMTVAADAGSYEKPMGKLGEGGSWTATTMGAGVDGKPLPGKATKVTGEIIDLSCYLQLGKHGEKHVACGKKCLQAGQPVGLLAKDGTIYMLMEEEHDPRRDGQTTAFRKDATNHLGHIMEVSGVESTVRGYRAIYVEGFVNK